MTSTCDWIPPLVLLKSYGGDWLKYIETVYQFFKADFVDSTPKYINRDIRMKRYPLFQSKEYTFWHITSEGTEEEKRTPDIRRCERIRWPRPILEHCPTDLVRCWPNKHGREKRIVLWFFNEDYVIVLADRKNYVLLWTAYIITYDHTRNKMLKEYEEYQKQLTPPF